MISVIIAVLFAALVYALCLALGLPAIVGLIAAILVLLAGIPTGDTASADVRAGDHGPADPLNAGGRAGFGR